MNKRRMERGQALIIIALALVGLVGVAALVVDGGNVFLDRRNAQNAADSAALASAFTRIKGGDWVGAAIKSAAENGYDNDGVTNFVQVYSPPKDGPFVGNVEYIQVIITSHVNTYFARAIGRNTITNIIESTARSKSPEVKELLNGMAIVSLAPTSNCSNKKSFWVHQEATLDITGGGIFINSNNPTCALIQQGNGSIRIRDHNQINMVGGAQIHRIELLTPAMPTKATPLSYPPPFFMPKVGCGKSAEVSEDGTTMSPGNWDEKFPPEGVTRLEEGMYCLGGGMHITEDIDGTNVTFYVEKGEVRFDKWAKISLGAPAGGDLKGLLIYLPMENQSDVRLNGGPESEIIGTILAPASKIIIQGNSSPRGFHSQIIGYTIEANGDNNVIIKYTVDENWQSLTMPEVQLAE